MSYIVGGIFGALIILGASFTLDILIPGLLSPRVAEPTVQPEDVRPLTDRLSALAADLWSENDPRAREVEQCTFDALDIERKARGFGPVDRPVSLLRGPVAQEQSVMPLFLKGVR